MDKAMMDKGPDFEQVLLSHVGMCYSVALALTRNPNRAAELSKEVLSRAWQCNAGAWDANSLKMALLSELRARYLRQSRITRRRPASREEQLQEAGV